MPYVSHHGSVYGRILIVCCLDSTYKSSLLDLIQRLTCDSHDTTTFYMIFATATNMINMIILHAYEWSFFYQNSEGGWKKTIYGRSWETSSSEFLHYTSKSWSVLFWKSLIVLWRTMFDQEYFLSCTRGNIPTTSTSRGAEEVRAQIVPVLGAKVLSTS